jgi:hypothetical protein
MLRFIGEWVAAGGRLAARGARRHWFMEIDAILILPAPAAHP